VTAGDEEDHCCCSQSEARHSPFVAIALMLQHSEHRKYGDGQEGSFREGDIVVHR